MQPTKTTQINDDDPTFIDTKNGKIAAPKKQIKSEVNQQTDKQKEIKILNSNVSKIIDYKKIDTSNDVPKITTAKNGKENSSTLPSETKQEKIKPKVQQNEIGNRIYNEDYSSECKDNKLIVKYIGNKHEEHTVNEFKSKYPMRFTISFRSKKDDPQWGGLFTMINSKTKNLNANKTIPNYVEPTFRDVIKNDSPIIKNTIKKDILKKPKRNMTIINYNNPIIKQIKAEQAELLEQKLFTPVSIDVEHYDYIDRLINKLEECFCAQNPQYFNSKIYKQKMRRTEEFEQYINGHKIFDVGMYDQNGNFSGIRFKIPEGLIVFPADKINYDAPIENKKIHTSSIGPEGGYVCLDFRYIGNYSIGDMLNVDCDDSVDNFLYNFDGNIIGKKKPSKITYENYTIYDFYPQIKMYKKNNWIGSIILLKTVDQNDAEINSEINEKTHSPNVPKSGRLALNNAIYMHEFLTSNENREKNIFLKMIESKNLSKINLEMDIIAGKKTSFLNSADIQNIIVENGLEENITVLDSIFQLENFQTNFPSISKKFGCCRINYYKNHHIFIVNTADIINEVIFDIEKENTKKQINENNFNELKNSIENHWYVIAIEEINSERRCYIIDTTPGISQLENEIDYMRNEFIGKKVSTEREELHSEFNKQFRSFIQSIFQSKFNNFNTNKKEDTNVNKNNNQAYEATDKNISLKMLMDKYDSYAYSNYKNEQLKQEIEKESAIAKKRNRYIYNALINIGIIWNDLRTKNLINPKQNKTDERLEPEVVSNIMEFIGIYNIKKDKIYYKGVC